MFVAEDDVTQCQQMWKEVDDYIRDAADLECGNVKAMCVELPNAGAKGARANRAMGIATGMVAGITAKWNLPSIWVAPRQSKLKVGGKADASKEEMQAAVRKLWPKFAWPTKQKDLEHIADAAAALIAAKESDVYKFLHSMAN